jgi:hypothetical protein
MIKMRKQMKLTNRKVATSLALTFLLLCVGAVGVASASGEQTQKLSQDYGTLENAQQYNGTEATPSKQMEQVRAMENYEFNYRNLTLTLNCTRNCDLNITVDPALKPKVLSLSVQPGQNMSLTMNLTSTPSEAEMVRTQTLNFYMGLEPNATLELKAQIRIHINQTELSQELNREINASRLTWQYYNTTEHAWVTVPSWIDQNNYLSCNTTHFSTWTVTEVSDQNSPQPEESSTPYPTQTPAASTSISPSATNNIADNSIKATDNPGQATPLSAPQSPSTSILAPDASEQKSSPPEYLHIGVGVALAAIVAIGLIAIKKRKP